MVNLAYWDRLWFKNSRSNNTYLLNSAFPYQSVGSGPIFSFASNNSDDEHDAIQTMIAEPNGNLHTTLLFGDNLDIPGSRGHDLCDNMNTLGIAVTAVVSETCFDLDALHKSGIVGDRQFAHLSKIYGLFFHHETHSGNENGSSGEIWSNRDNHVVGRMNSLLVNTQATFNSNNIVNAYLDAWNQNVHERTNDQNVYESAVYDVFSLQQYHFDFGFVGRADRNGQHLNIDTVNFASGLIEMAAVEGQVDRILNHGQSSSGLSHDDIVTLAGLHDWRDLRAIDATTFDKQFGGAEKIDNNGNVTLDIGVAEVLNHGVIETAQKIIAIDEMVFAYNQLFNDNLESIFTILTTLNGGVSAEQHNAALANQTFKIFESGAITEGSIGHILDTGWWKGHLKNDYSVGFGLNELVQLKIAHFM